MRLQAGRDCLVQWHASPGIPRGNEITSRNIARAQLRCTQKRSRTTSRVGAQTHFLMHPQRQAAKTIAAAFLAGPLEKGAAQRIAQVINVSERQVRGLVARLLAHFGTRRRPRSFRVERFVMADRGFLRFSTKEGFEFYADVQWPRAMLPASGAACWMEGAAD